MVEKIDFMGMAFDNVTMDEALAQVERFIQEGTPHKIFTPNVALYVYSRSDEQLRHIYETSDLLTIDGMGIYYASRILGNPVREMVSGVFLMFEIIKLATEKGYKIYLLGTKEQILQKAVENLKIQYPTLNIVGWRNGYFTIEDEPNIANQIIKSNPDILFLGMSTPMKEQFASRNLEKIGVPVCLGVGGSFDVIAGVYKLAPKWMRKAGLEWFYRLIQEPRRMWKRYLTTNTVFAYLVFKALMKRIFRFGHRERK